MNELIASELTEKFIELWKQSGKEKTLRIRGTSMLPLIKEGDAIGVVPVAQGSDISTGDIALFRKGAGIIAHRIIGKFEKDGVLYFKEKGDQRFLPTVISQGMLIGKVIRIYKPKTTLQMTTSLWLIINRGIGHYWQGLFALFAMVSTLKAAFLGAKKFPRISSAYQKLSQFLIKLPTTIFRLK